MRRARLAVPLALLAFSACSQNAADYGEALFSDPRFSDSQFNAFSCATCHRTDGEDPAVRVGSSLENSAYRPRYWGGGYSRLIDAVSFCSVYFMRSGSEVDPAEARGRALYEFLARISPERPSPVKRTTFVENIVEVPRGDAVRGREVYAAACKGCHGEPRTGEGRLTPAAVIVPTASEGYAAEIGVSTALVVIEKVRHGQFFGVGGNMPPFSREALSQEDLGALLSYLEL